MSSHIQCLAHCRCLINGLVVICVSFFLKSSSDSLALG